VKYHISAREGYILQVIAVSIRENDHPDLTLLEAQVSTEDSSGKFESAERGIFIGANGKIPEWYHDDVNEDCIEYLAV